MPVKANIVIRYTLANLRYLEELTKIELETGVSFVLISQFANPEVFYGAFSKKEEKELLDIVRVNFRSWPKVKKLKEPFNVEPKERLKLIQDAKAEIEKYG
jgi:hypothetical protein